MKKIYINKYELFITVFLYQLYLVDIENGFSFYNKNIDIKFSAHDAFWNNLHQVRS